MTGAFDSIGYWESRYREGGDSGWGSQGAGASFKAKVLNSFVHHHRVESVTELGCGDGSQLALGRYPKYVGLDVSPTAVGACIQRFADDPTKSFFVYDPLHHHDPSGVFRSELATSLDVIYHLVEDDRYERYMTHLFGMASRFVAIYSTNTTDAVTGQEPHVRHRTFTEWIARNRPAWRPLERIANPFVRDTTRRHLSSDFFVYASQGAGP